MLNIITHSTSLTGKRKKNEDEIDIINNLNNNDKNIKKIVYSAIFDGHGGEKIAKILKNNYDIANYIINNECKEIKTTKEYNEHIIKIFNIIQKKLINTEIKANKMGSTCLMSLIYPKNTSNILNTTDNDFNIKIINLGDCRAVLCNKYLIGVPLSKDHKPSRWDEKKRITELGGIIKHEKGDDPRISGLSVSRCFGDLDCDYISQNPEIFDYKLDKDKFLVLGCDGLWDVLSNQEVVDFILSKLLLQKKITNQGYKNNNNNNIAHLLGNYAIELGSNDNISINIIFFINNINELY